MNNAQWIERALLWLFPRRCVWCRGVTEPASMLCHACEREAAPLRLPKDVLPGTEIPLISVFPYHSKAKGIFSDMKFNGGRGLAHSIGYAMGDAARRSLDKPESWLLCPVPMTDAKVKARGYNQSALLAQAAAKWTGAFYAPDLLRKTRETDVQHELPAAQRERNVEGAFDVPRSGHVEDKRVVLCDDICTTGATLRACCKALETAGADEIVCLTFLHTILEE